MGKLSHLCIKALEDVVPQWKGFRGSVVRHGGRFKLCDIGKFRCGIRRWFQRALDDVRFTRTHCEMQKNLSRSILLRIIHCNRDNLPNSISSFLPIFFGDRLWANTRGVTVRRHAVCASDKELRQRDRRSTRNRRFVVTTYSHEFRLAVCLWPIWGSCTTLIQRALSVVKRTPDVAPYPHFAIDWKHQNQVVIARVSERESC